MKNVQEEFYKMAGRRIRKLRVSNNYSREVLAEKANISTKFLYEIETGKKGFSAYTLESLARALDVNSNYILSQQKDVHQRKVNKSGFQDFNETDLHNLRQLIEIVNKFIDTKQYIKEED
ncbi:MAG TPA: hypothetical protein DCW90_15695 [Lachnospiraceae bacterium]|nr:helix-turn-helix transcriptional regulator [uncultured Lachnoclostridium sp.]HAU86873.1 hypothetical protein [Lachnospiraceae bacterium]